MIVNLIRPSWACYNYYMQLRQGFTL